MLLCIVASPDRALGHGDGSNAENGHQDHAQAEHAETMELLHYTEYSVHM